MHVLAGDIGGTKTDLALYAVDAGGVCTLVREARFDSRRHPGLDAVLTEFGVHGHAVAAAAFGVAGPVLDDAVSTTNLPWRIEAKRLSQALGGAPVRLLNDLEAMAHGTLVLGPADLYTVNAGRPRPGHRAVIAAGTGLGQAYLFWDGTRFLPAATEGGHADFAPRNDLEADLLRFLRTQLGRVSWERVVSGPGIANIFRFLTEVAGRPVSPEIASLPAGTDLPPIIGAAATDLTCSRAPLAVPRGSPASPRRSRRRRRAPRR